MCRLLAVQLGCHIAGRTMKVECGIWVDILGGGQRWWVQVCKYVAASSADMFFASRTTLFLGRRPYMRVVLCCDVFDNGLLLSVGGAFLVLCQVPSLCWCGIVAVCRLWQFESVSLE